MNVMEAFLIMRPTDEEILEHGRCCKKSGLGQKVYLSEHLASALTVSQFRTRLYEARRQAAARKKEVGFIPIEVEEYQGGLKCVLRGKNSLSVEWKAASFAEVRKFALAVLLG